MHGETEPEQLRGTKNGLGETSDPHCWVGDQVQKEVYFLCVLISVVAPDELQPSPGGPGDRVHVAPLGPGRDEGQHADAYQTGESQPDLRAAGSLWLFWRTSGII